MGSSSRSKHKPKRSRAQKQQTADAQAHWHKTTVQISSREPTKRALQQELRNTQRILSSTEQELHDARDRLSITEDKLSTAETAITTARRNYSTLFAQKSDIYKLLRTERRKNQRYAAAKLELLERLKEQSISLEDAQQELAIVIQQRDRALDSEGSARLRMSTLLNQSNAALARVKQLLSDSRRKTRALEMKNLRSVRSRDKAREQARIAEKKLKKKNKWSLIEKGKYTAPAKSIARMLHKSGCTQGKVGSVISYIAKHAGLEVEGDMSRRTVQRALIEGGVAARVQLGYEMADADGTLPRFIAYFD
jgi:hypothetical protein